MGIEIKKKRKKNKNQNNKKLKIHSIKKCNVKTLHFLF